MDGYNVKLSLILAAADDDNIFTSAAVGGAGAIVLAGDLVTGTVATLDAPRRILITSSGDSSGMTFTVNGTDRNGKALTEVVTGPNATTGATTRDFATVTSVVASAAATGNIKVGTNATGSSNPYIVDRFINPAVISAYLALGAGDTAHIEVSYDDVAPYWEVEQTLPTWVTATVTNNTIAGPITMIRLVQTAGTALSTLTVVTPMAFGRA